jgi:hypothetical protein
MEFTEGQRVRLINTTVGRLASHLGDELVIQVKDTANTFIAWNSRTMRVIRVMDWQIEPMTGSWDEIAKLGWAPNFSTVRP